MTLNKRGPLPKNKGFMTHHFQRVLRETGRFWGLQERILSLPEKSTWSLHDPKNGSMTLFLGVMTNHF